MINVFSLGYPKIIKWNKKEFLRHQSKLCATINIDMNLAWGLSF